MRLRESYNCANFDGLYCELHFLFQLYEAAN